MGADGGVNWMCLKKSEYSKLAISLLQPLQLLNDNWRYGEDFDFDTIVDAFPSNCITSTYGTDRDIQGLDDLRDILGDEEIENDLRTFEEVAEDLATRPEWQMYKLSELEKLILYICGYTVWYNYCYVYRVNRDPMNDENRMKTIMEDIDHLGDLRNILVKDWARWLKNLLDWEHVGMIETWT